MVGRFMLTSFIRLPGIRIIQGFEASMGILAATQATGTPEGDRQAAIAQYAMMVGALTLARATKGNGLSDEFLAAARNLLIPEKNLG